MLTSAEELGVWVTCERLCYTHASTLPEFASVCHLHSSSCALSSAHLQRKRVGSLGCHPSPSCRACRSFPRGTQMVLGAEGRADAAERAKKWPEDTRGPRVGWLGSPSCRRNVVETSGRSGSGWGRLGRARQDGERSAQPWCRLARVCGGSCLVRGRVCSYALDQAGVRGASDPSCWPTLARRHRGLQMGPGGPCHQVIPCNKQPLTGSHGTWG